MHSLKPIVRFWLFFAAAFNLLACPLASAHVLLHKCNSCVATLWIGFIWLLPVLGPVVYVALGVNRIRRCGFARCPWRFSLPQAVTARAK